MTTLKLPFFVYGTLRNGEGNYSWALKGKTIREERGTLTGVTMHGRTGFPYLVSNKDESGKAIGELMFVSDNDYAQILDSLDSLEGYNGPEANNHYDRLTRLVNTDAGEEIRAYVYIASEAISREIRKDIPVISSGDWVEHVKSQPTRFYSSK